MESCKTYRSEPFLFSLTRNFRDYGYYCTLAVVRLKGENIGFVFKLRLVAEMKTLEIPISALSLSLSPSLTLFEFVMKNFGWLLNVNDNT